MGEEYAVWIKSNLSLIWWCLAVEKSGKTNGGFQRPIVYINAGESGFCCGMSSILNVLDRRIGILSLTGFTYIYTYIHKN